MLANNKEKNFCLFAKTILLVVEMKNLRKINSLSYCHSSRLIGKSKDDGLTQLHKVVTM